MSSAQTASNADSTAISGTPISTAWPTLPVSASTGMSFDSSLQATQTVEPATAATIVGQMSRAASQIGKASAPGSLLGAGPACSGTRCVPVGGGAAPDSPP